MKNLFKKTEISGNNNGNGNGNGNGSGNVGGNATPKKQSSSFRKKKSPSTPPITPSPTKDASNISVRVIPSQKLSFALAHAPPSSSEVGGKQKQHQHQNQNQQHVNVNQQQQQYQQQLQILAHSANININSNINSNSNTNANANDGQIMEYTASDESNIFAAVLGLGCGSMLGTQNELTTIHEDDSEWGVPPVLSMDEDDDNVMNVIGAPQVSFDYSFDDHDDFEVVLQGEDDEGLPVFCQPCERSPSSPFRRRRKGGGSKSGSGSKSSNGDEEKKKRRFKMPKIKSKSRKSKKSAIDTASAASSASSGNDEVSSNASSVSSPNQKNRGQKNINTDNGTRTGKVRKEASLKKMQIGKLFHTKYHKKKKNGNADAGADGNADSSKTFKGKRDASAKSSKEKPKKGRWKCVHDNTTDRVYFYQTLTREVSWDRPAGFVVWRVSQDLNQRNFFYNVITKETTWDMPDDFILWKEFKDPKGGKSYYYNVLSKETTWEKPTDYKKSADGGDSAGAPVVADTSGKGSTRNEKDSSVGAPTDDIVSNAYSNKNNDKAASAQTAVDSQTVQPSLNTKDEAELNNQIIIADLVHVESEIESSPDRSTDMEDPPKIVKTENHTKLAKLLATYCPDENDNNAQLMNRCRGQETPVIKAIEGLLEDTPFDELRLAIFSFVKTTLREMGEEPYDERKTMWKRDKSKPSVSIPSPRRIKRVNTNATVGSSAGYSMTSRALSHVTGRSATTEQTNRIKNTKTRGSREGAQQHVTTASLNEFNEKWQNMSLDMDNSLDYMTDVTDEDNQNEVVLDMKVVGSKEAGSRESAKVEAPVITELKGKIESKKEVPRSSKEEEKQKAVSAAPSGGVAEGLLNSSNDAMTLESAYAADNDDETDNGEWKEEDVDDVSALSDSFGPAVLKRYRKEKKILTEKEESLRKKKAKKILSKYAREGKENNEPKIAQVMFVEERKVESSATMQYTSLNANMHDSDLSSASSAQSSIGYEQLPRSKGRYDEDSLSSWDDDTVTTNSSA